MLGRYRHIVQRGNLIRTRDAIIITRRWNSISTTTSTPEEKDKVENKTVTSTETGPDFMDFPWESNQNKTDISKADANLPWSTTATTTATSTTAVTTDKNENESQEEIITKTTDPSTSELILAPLRKKSSPIERLTHKKSIKSKDISSNNVNFQIERDYKNLMQFKYNVSNDDFINIIEELKPNNNIITIKQLSELSLNLDKSFKAKQIREYIKRKCPEINLKKSLNKKQLINKIISQHWNLKVTLDPTEDLIEETKIDLSNKRDLFLLLSNNGFLPQHWSLIGAQLSLGKSRKELVVRGSKNIVNFVQASWNDLLNNISSDTVDLSDVVKIYEKLGKKLDLNTLQQETGVYFDKVSFENNSFVLSAIKNISISNAKIEILKATEYRYGCNKVIIKELIDEAKKLDGGSSSLIKMAISDESLPWYIKPENYFRFSIDKKRVRESLLSDESMIVELLSEEVQDLKIEVEEAKEKFEYNYVQTEGDANVDKKKNNEKYDNRFFHIEKENNNNNNNNNININEEENLLIPIETISKELSECEFEGKDDETKLMLDNIISVKFGKLLFEKGDKKLENTYFDENLSESLRSIGKLELMDKESSLFGATGGIMNRFNKQIYVKLIPNGFWGGKFEHFIKFPSIDILFELKDGKLEVNKFSSFLSEFEKNVEVGIPNNEIDLKFQSSYNSMLVYNRDQWILNGRFEEDFRGIENVNEGEENDIIMNKKLINMFISQIGKRQFDIRRREGLVGMLKQFKHKPYTMSFPAKGKKKEGESVKVKYSAVKVELVQSIELEYEGLPVSFEIHDDGDNERVELSMLKEGVEMEEFINQSVSLSRFLGE